MADCRLTEKNMSNKRFRTTEKAIFVAYCKLKDYPTAKKLARVAKISRTTLYRHHQKAQTIPIDYENYLIKAYTKTTKCLIKRAPDLKILILRTLIFIYNHREVIKALFNDNHKEIIKQMFRLLKPSIIDEWHLAGDLAKMYNIYANEVLGVIEAWGAKGFPKNSIDQVLNDIMYLTDTARQKLLPIK